MKGHLRERSPGKWAIVVDVKDDMGRKKRKWHSFEGGKREAQKEAARLVNEIAEGRYVEPRKVLLSEYLEDWLLQIRPNVSPTTHARYGELLRKNVIPLLGHVPLTALNARSLRRAFADALESGRRPRKLKEGDKPVAPSGLSPRTVGHMRRVLSRALKQAVADRLIATNPVSETTAPRVEPSTVAAYDTQQTAKLLAFVRPTRIHMPVLLAVTCGLRRGEILALRWRHVDLDRRKLSITEALAQTDKTVMTKAPKSGKARTVALSQAVAAELRMHRARQAEELLRLGVPLDRNTYVVAQVDGSPLQPRSLTHEWVRIMSKSTLPRIRFHDLRHSHATQMLVAGIHPKVASERLGHSKIGITLDLYSHVLPDMQEDAAELVDRALRDAIHRLG